MNSQSTPLLAPRSGITIGALLRQWRSVRRLSQLQLALLADVSARHLSFVETGRAHASRDMVLRLAEALEVPLRERNPLLAAAGFAPCYFETDIASPEMANAREAVRLILSHQEPYPAFLLDRHWNIRQTNRAAERCTRFLLGRDPDEANMIRLVLAPDGLRPALLNWDQVAGDLITHLQHQVAAAPTDAGAAELLREVLEYPGVPTMWRQRTLDSSGTPLLTSVFRRADVELRFFSTLTTFGTPHDIALDDLRIECTFPADDRTRQYCRAEFG